MQLREFVLQTRRSRIKGEIDLESRCKVTVAKRLALTHSDEISRHSSAAFANTLCLYLFLFLLVLLAIAPWAHSSPSLLAATFRCLC
jgi:hypothetical protein